MRRMRRIRIWSQNGGIMSLEDRIICPMCGQINPIDCKQADCPLENYFWSLDEDTERS